MVIFWTLISYLHSNPRKSQHKITTQKSKKLFFSETFLVLGEHTPCPRHMWMWNAPYPRCMVHVWLDLQNTRSARPLVFGSWMIEGKSGIKVLHSFLIENPFDITTDLMILIFPINYVVISWATCSPRSWKPTPSSFWTILLWWNSYVRSLGYWTIFIFFLIVVWWEDILRYF